MIISDYICSPDPRIMGLYVKVIIWLQNNHHLTYAYHNRYYSNTLGSEFITILNSQRRSGRPRKLFTRPPHHLRPWSLRDLSRLDKTRDLNIFDYFQKIELFFLIFLYNFFFILIKLATKKSNDLPILKSTPRSNRSLTSSLYQFTYIHNLNNATFLEHREYETTYIIFQTRAWCLQRRLKISWNEVWIPCTAAMCAAKLLR